MRISIDGPFTGSYSLALVNREMALALESLQPGSVSLSFHCRSEPDPAWRPDQAWLDGHPEVAELWQRGAQWSAAGLRPDVVLFNSWPPLLPTASFVDAAGGPAPLFLTNAYGWEESRFPPEHAAAFNDRLQGLTVMSDYVARTLVDNGVFQPIRVVGLGADHILRIAPEPVPEQLGEGYRFLHISSGFPRKALDVLLDAYGRAFTAADPVSLVIKTFPNPHNDAVRQVEQFRRDHPSPPGVVLINADLPDGCLVDLYQRCHCLVLPSRGEGFGLPLAEAMLLGMPVITTGHGGQCDFCTPETAWLIDYSLQPAASHLNPFGSVWAEPAVDHLARLLRRQLDEGQGGSAARVAAARDLIASRYTWRACARRLLDFVAERQAARLVPGGPAAVAPPRPRLALVTSWNARCGIAEYSRQLVPYLLNRLEVTVLAPRAGEPLRGDEPNVQRVWLPDDFCDTIPAALDALHIDRVLINFHFSFFPLPRFRQLLRNLQRRGVAVTVIFHAIRSESTDVGELADELAGAHRLLVHTVADLEFLRTLGLAGNSALFPHGAPPPEYRPRPPALVLPSAFREGGYLAAFGFLMPHKGVLQLIQAFALLAAQHPRLHLLLLTALYPKPGVPEYHQACQSAIREAGLTRRVRLVTDFLPDEEVRVLLASARLIVYPYQQSSESSSAAVRCGLASGAPVAVTPLAIFADVLEIVHQLPGVTAAELARGIGALLAEPALLAERQKLQIQWLETMRWPLAGQTLAGLLLAAQSARAGPERQKNKI